jgi:hypothetical protein
MSTKSFRHLPAFMGLLILVIGLTITLTLTINNTYGGRSSAGGYNCLLLPPCYNKGTCPDITNYNIPNFRWCLPRPTPTPAPSGCYYVPVACPAIACAMGEPCPTCAPLKLVCPSPTPTPSSISCGSPSYMCPIGFTCGHCTGAIPVGGPTPEPNAGCTCIPNPTPTLTPAPTPTINQTGCNTDSDCQNGAKCIEVGPIIFGHVTKACVGPGHAIPL